MNRSQILLALVAALALIVACGGDGDEATQADHGGDGREAAPLDSLQAGAQKASYALGVDLALQVDGMPGTDQTDVISDGLRDQLDGDARLDFAAAREIMTVRARPEGEMAGEGTDAVDEPAEDTWTDRGFESEDEQTAYAIGVTLGEIAGMQLSDLDQNALAQGVTDKLTGAELMVEEGRTREIVISHMQARQQEMASVNLAAGNEFLEKNKDRDGVEITDSGLQYEVLQEGDGGTHPSPTDTVKVHYHGTLIEGTVFDSSVERGEPVEFPLNRVIPGWIEGVQLMTEGAKYKFFIPAELAYGERGAGSAIGPNSTLIFEVELLEIK